jgi:hypothetical protein
VCSILIRATPAGARTVDSCLTIPDMKFSVIRGRFQAVNMFFSFFFALSIDFSAGRRIFFGEKNKT